MSNICKECHYSGKGCCEIRHDNGQSYIGIMIPDILRIQYFNKQRVSEFIVSEYIDNDVINFLSEKVHPVFSDIYFDNKCFRLKTIQNRCCFLNELTGCELPENIRPLYCRIYPFWLSANNEHITVLSSNDCLAQKESLISFSLVNKYFNYTVEYIKNLFSQLETDAKSHRIYLEKNDFFNQNFNTKQDVQFAFRKLNSFDLPRIKEICMDIWDGTDYLPKLANQWIDDKRGIFLGAEYNNKLYGMCKISFYNPEIAWIEGLRADPHCNYKGFTKSFFHYIVDNLKKEFDKVKSVEFVTYFENYATIKIAQTLRFRMHTGFSFKFIELSPDESFSRLNEINCEEISDVSQTMSVIQKSNVVYEQRLFVGWKALPWLKSDNDKNEQYIRNEIKHYRYCDEFSTIDICLRFDSDLKDTNIICIAFSSTDDSVLSLYKQAIDHIKHLSYINNCMEINLVVNEKNANFALIDKYYFKSYEKTNDYLFFDLKI